MKINNNRLERILEYKNALARFEALGFSRIFSHYLAESVGVSSVQIRKDFSSCHIIGNKKGGYDIAMLQQSINDLLKKREPENIVLVGAGNLGNALAKYKGFEKEGFHLIAAFDIDPTKCNTENGFPIYPFSEIAEFVRNNNVITGIIAVPELVAPQVLNDMAAAGIKGILNFAPCKLHYPDENVTILNVNLALELEKLSYHVRRKEASKWYDREKLSVTET